MSLAHSAATTSAADSADAASCAGAGPSSLEPRGVESAEQPATAGEAAPPTGDDVLSDPSDGDDDGDDAEIDLDERQDIENVLLEGVLFGLRGEMSKLNGRTFVVTSYYRQWTGRAGLPPWTVRTFWGHLGPPAPSGTRTVDWRAAGSDGSPCYAFSAGNVLVLSGLDDSVYDEPVELAELDLPVELDPRSGRYFANCGIFRGVVKRQYDFKRVGWGNPLFEVELSNGKVFLVTDADINFLSLGPADDDYEPYGERHFFYVEEEEEEEEEEEAAARALEAEAEKREKKKAKKRKRQESKAAHKPKSEASASASKENKSKQAGTSAGAGDGPKPKQMRTVRRDAIKPGGDGFQCPSSGCDQFFGSAEAVRRARRASSCRTPHRAHCTEPLSVACPPRAQALVHAAKEHGHSGMREIDADGKSPCLWCRTPITVRSKTVGKVDFKPLRDHEAKHVKGEPEEGFVCPVCVTNHGTDVVALHACAERCSVELSNRTCYWAACQTDGVRRSFKRPYDYKSHESVRVRPPRPDPRALLTLSLALPPPQTHTGNYAHHCANPACNKGFTLTRTPQPHAALLSTPPRRHPRRTLARRRRRPRRALREHAVPGLHGAERRRGPVSEAGGRAWGGG